MQYYLLEDGYDHGYITSYLYDVIGLVMHWAVSGVPPSELSKFRDTNSLTLFELNEIAPKFSMYEEEQFDIEYNEDSSYKRFVYSDGRKVRIYKNSFKRLLIAEYCL